MMRHDNQQQDFESINDSDMVDEDLEWGAEGISQQEFGEIIHELLRETKAVHNKLIDILHQYGIETTEEYM